MRSPPAGRSPSLFTQISLYLAITGGNICAMAIAIAGNCKYETQIL
ncbi:hypothetical protein GS682_25915 [Nostoc sp. B(2019)]|nr:hypothetical protein [Nostoc sp. B(2019)]